MPGFQLFDEGIAVGQLLTAFLFEYKQSWPNCERKENNGCAYDFNAFHGVYPEKVGVMGLLWLSMS